MRYEVALAVQLCKRWCLVTFAENVNACFQKSGTIRNQKTIFEVLKYKLASSEP